MNISYDFIKTEGITIQDIICLVEPYEKILYTIQDQIIQGDNINNVKNQLKSILNEIQSNPFCIVNDVIHPVTFEVERMLRLIKTKELLSNNF